MRILTLCLGKTCYFCANIFRFVSSYQLFFKSFTAISNLNTILVDLIAQISPKNCQLQKRSNLSLLLTEIWVDNRRSTVWWQYQKCLILWILQVTHLNIMRFPENTSHLICFLVLNLFFSCWNIFFVVVQPKVGHVN